MDWLFRAAELSGLLVLILVASRLHRRAYGAGRVVIGEETQHGLREILNLWAAFLGILLIAILCWFLATSILGEGWPASCVAVLLFFAIGLNLMDDEFDDSDDSDENLKS